MRSYADKKTHARAIKTHERVFWFQGGRGEIRRKRR
nr:MAG TPA: hypothetical protein [Caudoviricetes sp.]